MTFAGDAHELVFHPSSQLASSTVQRGTNGQVGIPVCIYIYIYDVWYDGTDIGAISIVYT